jgi:hypothetical protein
MGILERPTWFNQPIPNKELFWDIKAESKTNEFKDEVWNNLNNNVSKKWFHPGSLNMDDQMDIIRRFKWREMDSAKIRHKMRNLVDWSQKNLRKRNKFLWSFEMQPFYFKPNSAKMDKLDFIWINCLWH